MIDGDRGRASFALPQLPTSAGPGIDAAAAAAALSIEPGDIGFDGFVPSRWSAGLEQNFIPVRSLAAIARARPDSTRFAAAFATEGRGIAYLFCGEVAEKGHDFHARMFAHGLGLYEDPATGSAAAAFSGVLAARGKLTEGGHTFRIEQGYEMGRPSLIELMLTITGGRLAAATIGGGAVVVTEGMIEA
jgi:trans-2,3-dihydro-3-hydroxyanthranilate isomerase